MRRVYDDIEDDASRLYRTLHDVGHGQPAIRDALRVYYEREVRDAGNQECTGCRQRVPRAWTYCAHCGAQGRNEI